MPRLMVGGHALLLCGPAQRIEHSDLLLFSELPGGAQARADMVCQDVVYLGSHQHLAVDIELSVDAEGGLRLRSGEQRFYEDLVAFRFPMLFSGIAEVREWYDEREQCFRIVVDVRNKTWGRLFGYRGRFNVDWQTLESSQVPTHVLPLRQERRE